MVRSDYIKFAKLIASEVALANSERSCCAGDKSCNCCGEDLDTKLSVINDIKLSIADILACDNPLFDREKFIKACEVK